jgi:hypothetical protein
MLRSTQHDTPNDCPYSWIRPRPWGHSPIRKSGGWATTRNAVLSTTTLRSLRLRVRLSLPPVMNAPPATSWLIRTHIILKWANSQNDSRMWYILRLHRPMTTGFPQGN